MAERIHFVGIGGTGLSAIAKVLLERGVEVSGSDQKRSLLAEKVAEAGAVVSIGHDADNVQGADLVIMSSAVPEDNVEILAARQAGIPVLKRVDFLEQLMEGKKGIAIAGTHGKTTTTSMVAWMLTALEQSPSFIVGGIIQNLGTNARSGEGSVFIIEADEYDHMFLGLKPYIAVVTNIEHDHPDLFPTPESFYEAFLRFGDRLSPEGVLLYCGDDQGATRLAQDLKKKRKTLAYGFDGADYEYVSRNVRPNPWGGYTFDLYRAGHRQPEVNGIELQVPGMHNVWNALAALAIADQLGLSLPQAALAISAFQGCGRRFDVRGEFAGVTIIDDYAHHPTEIKATLKAAREAYPERRIWAVWQPHTFTRTQLLFERFVTAFENADRVLVTDVFAARETAPPDFSARSLVEEMDHPEAHFLPELEDGTRYLLDHVRSGDVVIVLTAGDAIQISERLAQHLGTQER